MKLTPVEHNPFTALDVARRARRGYADGGGPDFSWVDQGIEPVDAQAAREAAAGVGRRSVLQRHEGAPTRFLEGLGENIYNTAAKPSRIWNELQGVPAGQPLSERPDIVDAVAQVSTDMLGAPAITPGLVAPASSIAANALKRTRGLAMDEESRLARAAEQGYDFGWYHGGERMDRFTEKGKIDPKRATSGPMPFFTDSTEMASGYASGKKADTSLAKYDTGDVRRYFTVNPKDLGHTGRTPYTVEQSWYSLSPEQKADILDKAKRVGYAEPDTASGPLVLHPPGSKGVTLSDDHLDWVLKHEARGNPLAALREMWHDGGNLVGNETALADIYRLAGYPHPISEATAPWTQALGVFPAALKMKNPLRTDDTATLRDKVIPALEEAFKRDRTRKQQFGADMWDKNTRYTPREWVETLKENLAKGDNSFVFTSIPDKVSAQLARMGYDGILDTGGKMGGIGHRVAIPFRQDQVRSKYARFDPANEGTGFLLGANAGRMRLIPVDHDPFAEGNEHVR